LAYTLLAVVLIAAPSSKTIELSCLTAIFCGERGAADAILNWAFFVPLGLLIAWAGVRPVWLAPVACLILSLTLEIYQLTAPGRTAALGDVVFDTLGGATGMVIFLAVARGPKLDARMAVRLATAWAGLVLLIFGLTAAVFQRSLPRSIYWGQWTPILGHREPYLGRVLSAEIGGIPLPPHRLQNSSDVRKALVEGKALEVRLIVGPPPPDLASIFSIADDRSREISLVGAEGHELVFRTRTRAPDLLLDPPELRAPMPPTAIGDTMTLEVRQVGSGVAVTIDSGPVFHRRLTLGRGWNLLRSPSGLSEGARTLLDGLWWLALTVPLGFLYRAGAGIGAVASDRSVVWKASVPILFVFLGAAIVPAVTNLGPTGPVGWGGLLGGLALGWGVRRVQIHSTPRTRSQ
jgi:VanZ like family